MVYKYVKPHIKEEGRGNDTFDPDDRRCTLCKLRKHHDCDRVAGGPPCIECMVRGQMGVGCTLWSTEDTMETVNRDYYKLVEVGDHVEVIRLDDDKVEHTRTAPKNRKPKPQLLADTDSESEKPPTLEEPPTAEESRARARQRLAGFKLPNTNLATTSLPLIMTTIANSVDLTTTPEPRSYKEALQAPDAKMWMEAIQDEYNSLQSHNTWEIVDVPRNRRPLTTKWVLKKKLGPGGELIKYKARMVARGFQQVEGYDFTDTYSGVVKAASYRILFALLALLGWKCHQMDVVTAFLNGDIQEEIYIHPPEGYATPGKALKLLKALYGLKQAPRQWYRKLRQWLLDNGWKVSAYDECVFLNQHLQLIITVYVDDVNIFGPYEHTILEFKEMISKRFKMTDAGTAAYYLGMQIEWQDNGVRIHQEGYARQILNRFNLTGIKPVATPLQTTHGLVTEKQSTSTKDFQHNYMSQVGSINYLQSKTRPDLSFPVSLVSRFMQNPNQEHADALTRQYAYLAKQPRAGLHYTSDGNAQLNGYVDSDWGGCKDTGRSTTGWIFTLAGGPVSWASQRQKTVSSSSTEAEYVAASDACKRAIWLQGFMNEVKDAMRQPRQETIPLHIDNASAIKLTKNPEFHGRTKHINIRHHFIRECVESKAIEPRWISGKENTADMLTKSLPKQTFNQYLTALRLNDSNDDLTEDAGPHIHNARTTTGALAPVLEGEYTR